MVSIVFHPNVSAERPSAEEVLTPTSESSTGRMSWSSVSRAETEDDWELATPPSTSPRWSLESSNDDTDISYRRLRDIEDGNAASPPEARVPFLSRAARVVVEKSKVALALGDPTTHLCLIASFALIVHDIFTATRLEEPVQLFFTLFLLIIAFPTNQSEFDPRDIKIKELEAKILANVGANMNIPLPPIHLTGKVERRCTNEDLQAEKQRLGEYADRTWVRYRTHIANYYSPIVLVQCLSLGAMLMTFGLCHMAIENLLKEEHGPAAWFHLAYLVVLFVFETGCFCAGAAAQAAGEEAKLKIEEMEGKVSKAD